MVDGCEWSPGDNRPAWTIDRHHRETPATIIVGADGQWRLCDACAALPRFRRYRTRKKIDREHFEAIAKRLEQAQRSLRDGNNDSNGGAG
jgi:hypothetical protein